MRMDIRETVSASALTSVPLPEFNSLSQAQVRGIACVWDGVPLSTATAVDLGERKVRHFGGLQTSWFPRGCLSCTAGRAYRALLDHSALCLLCAPDTPSQCDVGQGLYRLYQDSRR